MINAAEKSVWEHALSRFQLIDWEEPITESEVNDLKEVLLKKNPTETTKAWLKRILTSITQDEQETLSQWIQRLFKHLKSNSKLSAQESSECLTTWVNSLNINFNPVTEIVRHAAAPIEVEKYPLPDNDMPLITEDACFQFFIKSEATMISIEAQALGLAIEDYADTLISLSDYETPNEIVAVISLNDSANGECMVKNNLTFRKMLTNPKIGCLSD